MSLLNLLKKPKDRKMKEEDKKYLIKSLKRIQAFLIGIGKLFLCFLVFAICCGVCWVIAHILRWFCNVMEIPHDSFILLLIFALVGWFITMLIVGTVKDRKKEKEMNREMYPDDFINSDKK